MTTIKDIAKIAGVSVTTVSKVINNYPDISEKTKEKVLQVMEQENFKPNAIARSLSTNESHSIGIFFTDHLNSGLRHPFFRDIIYGIERELFAKGYDLILFAHRWGERFSYTEKCQNRNVDGAILMGMPRTDPNLDKLINTKIPVVFVDLDIVGRNAGYVISDNVQGARKAVNYLYQLGHQEIGMIMGQCITKPAQDRLIGFQQEFGKLRLSYNPDWIIEAEFSEEGGYQAMNQILRHPQRPTAIFCQCDEMAIGAMKAIEEQGCSVPDDFSIIGFDDIEISRYIRPGLTTIAQDKLSMGQTAAELLLKIIQNPNRTYSPAILPTELIERETCKERKQMSVRVKGGGNHESGTGETV